MRPILSTSLLALSIGVLSSSVFAQSGGGDGNYSSLQVGRGLICNTEQQVERYVTLFEGDSDKAVGTVNAEAHDDNACAVASVAFIPGSSKQATLRNAAGSFRVVQIVVVGIVTPVGVQKVPPFVQFAVAPVEEVEI